MHTEYASLEHCWMSLDVLQMITGSHGSYLGYLWPCQTMLFIWTNVLTRHQIQILSSDPFWTVDQDRPSLLWASYFSKDYLTEEMSLGQTSQSLIISSIYPDYIGITTYFPGFLQVGFQNKAPKSGSYHILNVNPWEKQSQRLTHSLSIANMVWQGGFWIHPLTSLHCAPWTPSCWELPTSLVSHCCSASPETALCLLSQIFSKI